MKIPSIFSQKALETVPRVLGFIDRDSASKTFGCCDRNYWHYRLTDVSNARFQEAGWLLALAHALPVPGSVFYQNEKILLWVRGIWNFWLARRNGDGSVTEVYPHERSFCATAFSTAAFVETARFTGGAAAWGAELRAARPTIDWLAKHSQGDTANQMAASLLAITGYAELARDFGFADAVRRRGAELRKMADADGRFNEYGGWDTGYQSITMSVLARVNALVGGDEWTDVLRRGEKQLSARIGPQGEVDAARNSRHTQFVYPYGLSSIGSAAVESLARGLEAQKLLSPAWMDDRYCIALASDYLMTSEEMTQCL